MIYIKYTLKKDPTQWDIWAHERGSKEETQIINSNGSTYSYIMPLCIKHMSTNWNIEYITEQEVDLLKLELL